jgi:HAD superfamily hydrolase (TIGR01549 family)
MYKHFIFDVDGTILDTEAVILKSLQQVLAAEGLDYSFEELRFVLGIPGKEALHRLKLTETDQIHAQWINLMSAYSHEVDLFHGLEETLQALDKSSVTLGIVTSKTRQEVEDEFKPYGLNPLFQSIISADDTERHKPHPDPLLACLADLEASPHETIYIGDSIYDLQSAKEAEVAFALALWGSKTTDQFAAADYILETPTDVLALLE